MKIFGGICGILLAIGLPLSGWLAYADMAKLHDTGSEGTLIVLSKVEETRGVKGSVARIYDASLAEVRIRIKTGAIYESGVQVPVLYLPEKLKPHSPVEFLNDGVEYIVGRKIETKSGILIRELGWPSIWVFVVFESLVIASSLWLLAAKAPNQVPGPTFGPTSGRGSS